MSENLKFYKATERNIKTLGQYIPIVERVHGDSHPEFHEVRKLFDLIMKKIKNAKTEESKLPELDEELLKLRKITDGYKVPDDVCESYEAVYNMLAEIDKAYQELK